MGRGDASEQRRGANAAHRGDELSTPKLRRGLFGYRGKDVAAAVAAWEAALAELRDDVAALWVAFAEHDRAIDSRGSERSTPDPMSAPPAPTPRPEPGPMPPTPPGDHPEPFSVEQQLADLDDVLSAIETATRTLEQSYSDDAAEPPATADERRSSVSSSDDRDDSA